MRMTQLLKFGLIILQKMIIFGMRMNIKQNN
jgi:hypothetical protein